MSDEDQSATAAPILRPPPHETLSEILARLGDGPEDEEVAIGHLIEGLADRAYGMLFFLLAVPNFSPGPSMPGFSTVLAIPLIMVAAQLALARPRPWLPDWLLRLRLRRKTVRRFFGLAIPAVNRLEGMLRPRLTGLVIGAGRPWLGLALVILGVVLAAPIPLFSLLPAGAMVLVGLGMTLRDGVAVLVGLGGGAVSIAALIGLILAAQQIFEWLGWA